MNVLKKDTQSLILYTNDFYQDVSLPQSFSVDETDKLCASMGMKQSTLLWYISMKKRNKSSYELYKETKKGKLIRLF